MRVYFGARPLEPELAGQKARPIRSRAGPSPESVFEKRAPCALAALDDARVEFLFRYDIFPSNVLRFWGEWQSRGGRMRAGDTIVQEAAMPPVAWGARLLFGARVTGIHRTPSSASFTYETLDSHAETGINTFGIHLENGEAVARVLSRAEPGNILMRAAGPVVMSYADWCKRVAVERMFGLFLGAQAADTSL